MQHSQILHQCLVQVTEHFKADRLPYPTSSHLKRVKKSMGTMANSSTYQTTNTRYAVVTGANKGIGFEVVKQLASNHIVVVLTARDEKRGLEALEKLKADGLSEYVLFHQLNVTDPESIAALAEFVKSKFGKLDILVNNAGIGGYTLNAEAFKAAAVFAYQPGGATEVDWSAITCQSYESAVECVQTNYYGAKKVTESLLQCLQSSDNPIIVNVSSYMGMLKDIPGEQIKQLLNDINNLNESKLDNIVEEFLKDLKEEDLESKGWPTFLGGYTLSKASLNAYARIFAKKHPDICINSVCPGYVKTDINLNIGILSAEDGAANVVSLALLPKGAASGRFFLCREESEY